MGIGGAEPYKHHSFFRKVRPPEKSVARYYDFFFMV
jgi:hypothetical protein